MYIGSSIYAPGEGEIQQSFNVGPIAASLGISLYVLACKTFSLLFNIKTTTD